MYSDDSEQRKQIAEMLPFFCTVMKSAMMRNRHFPASFGLVTRDLTGGRVEIVIPLDFTDEENLHRFDTFLLPMVRSMVETAECLGMTAFSNMFDEPVLRHALEHGVGDMDMMAVYRLQEPVREQPGSGDAERVILPFPAPGPRP